MSFADKDGVIWFDGELVPWREAKTHVLTHTLHYGMGVFEGVRATVPMLAQRFSAYRTILKGCSAVLTFWACTFPTLSKHLIKLKSWLYEKMGWIPPIFDPCASWARKEWV